MNDYVTTAKKAMERFRAEHPDWKRRQRPNLSASPIGDQSLQTIGCAQAHLIAQEIELGTSAGAADRAAAGATLKANEIDGTVPTHNAPVIRPIASKAECLDKNVRLDWEEVDLD